MLNIELRPHQKQVISKLAEGIKAGHKNHLVYAPTGMGKTVIAAYVASKAIEQGKRVLFVAPYTTLVEQTYNRFMEYGLPSAGIIWQRDHRTNPNKPLQIASADTLTRRGLPETDLLIWDEAHIKRKPLLTYLTDSEHPNIGLTATPYTKWIGTYYTNLIKVTTVKELIEKDYLSKFEVFAPTKPNLKGVKTSNLAAFGLDYNEAQIAEIMGDNKVVGDIVTNWVAHGNNEPTIAFCCNVKHANHITNEFNRVGVAAEVMTADTPKDVRQEIIKRFEDGITKIICNVGVLVAGFDSDVRCIIYARPTKSEIRWQQCLGRGLRTAPGKEKLTIFDHSGTVLELGFPDQIEYDYLRDDSDGMKSGEGQEYQKKPEPLPRECKQCNFMKPPGTYQCPKCGYKGLYGEDVETDRGRGLQQVKGKKKHYTMGEKQQWYSGYLGYAKQKGYKEGWAANKYRDKFGVWPNQLDKIAKEPTPDVLNDIKASIIAWVKAKQKRSAHG